MRVFVLTCAVAITTAACSDLTSPDRLGTDADPFSWAATGGVCTDESPITILPDSLRAVLPAPGMFRTSDQDQVEFARRVPGGYAGRYLEDGELVIMLVDTTQLEAVVAELELTSWYRPEAIVRAKQARWDFGQLYDWYRHLAQYIHVVDGLTMTDIDEVQNRIEYGVTSEAARAELVTVLQAAAISCHLVATAIVENATADARLGHQ